MAQMTNDELIVQATVYVVSEFVRHAPPRDWEAGETINDAFADYITEEVWPLLQNPVIRYRITEKLRELVKDGQQGGP
jgi:hypothetical protein